MSIIPSSFESPSYSRNYSIGNVLPVLILILNLLGYSSEPLPNNVPLLLCISIFYNVIFGRLVPYIYIAPAT